MPDAPSIPDALRQLAVAVAATLGLTAWRVEVYVREQPEAIPLPIDLRPLLAPPAWPGGPTTA